MALSITIQEVREIEAGIWRTRIAAKDLRMLGEPARQTGNRSVLLLSSPPIYDPQRGTLTFNSSEICILNLGCSQDTVLVAGAALEPSADGLDHPAQIEPQSSGDQLFLSDLPVDLKDLGKSFLRMIRDEFKGELRFHSRSGKYVESPDNFWTVRIQTRDKSLRVTVRGRPESLGTSGSLELANDMSGYSSFKISSVAQLGEALTIFRKVTRKHRSTH